MKQNRNVSRPSSSVGIFKKPDHRYYDCLEPHTILCSWCGARDVFKPRCLRSNPTGNRQEGMFRNKMYSRPKHLKPFCYLLLS